MMRRMSSSKVPVGVTSATGYGVTLAAVVAAALDYIGGDHSAPTKTTLVLGVVAGVSFVTTQIGRYAQAKAQINASVYAAPAPDLPEPEEPSWLPSPQTTSANTESTLDLGDPTMGRWAPEPTAEKVRTLTDAELEDDPDMGEPLAATAESYVGDPKDKHGAEDHPA